MDSRDKIRLILNNYTSIDAIMSIQEGVEIHLQGQAHSGKDLMQEMGFDKHPPLVLNGCLGTTATIPHGSCRGILLGRRRRFAADLQVRVLHPILARNQTKAVFRI